RLPRAAGPVARHRPRRGPDARRHLAHAGGVPPRPPLPGGGRHPRRGDRPDLAEPAGRGHDRGVRGADRPAAGGGQRLAVLQGGRDLSLRRLGFAPTTCPTTPALEELFYPGARTIAGAARDLVEGTATGWLPEERPEFQSIAFKGPF